MLGDVDDHLGKRQHRPSSSHLAVRFFAFAALVASVVGCAKNGAATEDTEVGMTVSEDGQVVWDFRTPTTPAELGSSVDEFVELDGPVDLEVIFPGGRTITGHWEWGALGHATSGQIRGDAPPQPIDDLDLLEGSLESVDELRASAQRFIDEFGPAVSGSYESSIEEFLDGFEARVDAAGGQIRISDHGTLEGGGGSTSRSFTAAPQDGLDPAWLIRVAQDGVFVRTTIKFDPAADGATGSSSPATDQR